MKNNQSVLLASWVLALSLIGGCSRDYLPIVSIGDRTITVGDYSRFLGIIRHNEKNDSLYKSPIEKREFLQILIQNETLLKLARERKFQEDPGIQQQVRDFELDKMEKTFLEERLYRKIDYPRNKIQMMVDKMMRDSEYEYGLSQIVVSDEKIADDVFKLIGQGDPFDSLVSRFSLDKDSRSQGGSVGYVMLTGLEEAMTEVVLALQQGEVSAPLQLQDGYYLFKLNDKRPAMRKPKREGLEKKVVRQFQNKQKEQLKFDLIRKLIKKFSVPYDSQNIQMVLQKLPQNVARPDNPFPIFTVDELESPLVRFRDHVLKVYDFLYSLHMQVRFRGELPTFYKIEEIIDVLNIIFVGNLVIQEEAEREGFRKHPVVASEVISFREKLMLEKLRNIEIDQRDSVRFEEKREFFNSHRDYFQVEEGRRFLSRVVQSEGHAEELLELYRSGKNIFQSSINGKESISEPRFLEKREIAKEFREFVFSAPLDSVIGPFPDPEGWRLIKVTGIRPVQPAKFEQLGVRDLQAIQSFILENRFEQWIDSLVQHEAIDTSGVENLKYVQL